MTSLPRVSVVVPTLNQGRFIEQTLQSLLGQGYPDLEIIVMDGGSSDDTLEIVERYRDHIAHVSSGPDGGQAAAINEGFRHATGDILAWLNSDDYYLPGTLSAAVSAIGDPSEPILVYGGCLFVDEEGAGAWGRRARPGDFDELTEHDPLIQPSTFWTRAVWERTGPLDESFHFLLDWDWFVRARKHASSRAVDRYLSVFRLHADHKTGSGGDRRRAEVLRVIERHGTEDIRRAYRDIYPRYESIQRRLRTLKRFGLHRLRSLFLPVIYWRHGSARVHRVLGTLA